VRKCIVTMAAVCAAAGLVLAAEKRCSGAEIEIPPKGHPDTTGWDNLFKPDLSDAVFPAGIWTVEDGTITASKDEVIWTKKDYKSFAVDVEFKMGKAANSGVIVYCSNPGDWIPNSIEIQLLDDFAPKWAKADKTWKCGAVFGRLAPTKQTVKKAGEWNRCTVVCKENMIYVVVNGELVNTFDMKKWTDAKLNPDGTKIPPWLSKPAASLPTHGRVGLQGKHGGAPIWFRNMKIKEIE